MEVENIRMPEAVKPDVSGSSRRCFDPKFDIWADSNKDSQYLDEDVPFAKNPCLAHPEKQHSLAKTLDLRIATAHDLEEDAISEEQDESEEVELWQPTAKYDVPDVALFSDR